MITTILYADHLLLMDQSNTVIPNGAARKIAPHVGIVKRVLQLFDELVKCDEEGILKDEEKWLKEIKTGPLCFQEHRGLVFYLSPVGWTVLFV
jgi:hypothetical protein